MANSKRIEIWQLKQPEPLEEIFQTTLKAFAMKGRNNKEFIEILRQLYIIVNAFPFLSQKFLLEKQSNIQFPKKLLEFIQFEAGYEDTEKRIQRDNAQSNLRESCLITLIMNKCPSLLPISNRFAPSPIQKSITNKETQKNEKKTKADRWYSNYAIINELDRRLIWQNTESEPDVLTSLLNSLTTYSRPPQILFPAILLQKILNRDLVKVTQIWDGRKDLVQKAISVVEKEFIECMTKASIFSENKGIFQSIRNKNPSPVIEIDGTNATEFFTVMNQPTTDFFTDDQRMNILSFSFLFEWISTIYSKEEYTMDKNFQETIVTYCLRVNNQCQSSAAQDAAKSGWSNSQISNLSLLQSIRILTFLCKLDSSLVSKLFPIMKNIFNRRNIRNSPSLSLAVLKFFIDHSSIMLYDPDPIFRNFFEHCLVKHYTKPIVAFEVLCFCNENKLQILSQTTVFQSFFPLLIKLYLWFPDTNNKLILELLPAMVSPFTFTELFHFIVDLPLTICAMEKSEGVDLQELSNNDIRSLLTYYLRNESSDPASSINHANFWESSNTVLQEFCKNSMVTPRVRMVADFVPRLLEVFFDVLIPHADEKSLEEILPVIINRLDELYPLLSFQKAVRQTLVDKILAILHSFPHFVITLKSLITKLLIECTPGKNELIISLCWAIGEYANPSINPLCTTADINEFNSALVLFIYERLSLVKLGFTNIASLNTSPLPSYAPFDPLFKESEETSVPKQKNQLNNIKYDTFTTRLMLVVINALSKLAARSQGNIASTVIVSLTKILQDSPYLHPAVNQRASECISILKFPSIASAILDSPQLTNNPQDRSSHLDANTSLPFTLQSNEMIQFIAFGFHSNSIKLANKRRLSSQGGKGGRGSTKRRKTQEEEDEEEEEEIEEEEVISSDDQNGTEKPLSEYKYRKGSIKRVYLRDFVTYTDSEFIPGPSLNVIIGPNGSGKSSIVCALALGLGGKPNLLGRAKEISEFIKHGAKEAHVEIELSTGKGNSKVISRRIKADNSSDWKINKESVTHRDVEKLVRDLNIQIDNVCQFLPQDKVVTFAKLNQYELLKETERAIGKPEMLKSHEKLIEFYKKSQEVTLKNDQHKKSLEDLKKKNDLLERDVVRFQEREKLLAQVKIMEKKKPWLLFEEHKIEYEKIRIEVESAKKELENSEHKLLPLKEEMKKHDDIARKLEEVRKNHFGRLQKLDNERKAKFSEFGKADRDYDGLIEDLKRLQNRDKERKKRAENIKREIEKYKNELENLPKADEKEISNINNKIQRLDEENTNIRSNLSDIKFRMGKRHRQAQQLRVQLQELQNVQNKRIDILKKLHPQVYNARVWIHENKSKFEKEVFGPIFVEINILNDYHARCFEQSCPNWLLVAFICQTNEDYQTLMDNCYTHQKLQINVILTSNINDSSFISRENIDNLRRYGIEGWLSDFIEGPSPVKNAIQANVPLYNFAVGTQSTMGLVNKVLSETNLTSFFTPESAYSKTISHYGNRESSTFVNPLKHFTKYVSGIDLTEKNNCEIQLNDLKAEDREDDIKKNQLEEKDRYLEEQIDDLKRQRDQITQSKRRSFQLQSRISQKEEEYNTTIQEEDTTEQENKLKSKLKTTALKKLQLVKDMSSIFKKISETLTKSDFVVMEKLDNANDLIELNRNFQKMNEEMKGLRKRCDALETMKKNSKDELEKLRNNAEDKAPKTKELVEKFKEFPNTLAELEELIHQYNAKADMHYKNNPGIIQEYKKRENEIKELEEKLREAEETAENETQQMKKLKESWLDPLGELLAKINKTFTKYFENIGCKGRIELLKDEGGDFSKYGISIYVSFRENEQAHLLDAHTQSGGERSVTTMLFLISLQNLTQCPFRLVDEINQGMDPTNERMIFEEVTKTACLPTQPQFFLITPKLLPGLKFTPQMTVHCVMNGPWMLESAKWKKLRNK